MEESVRQCGKKWYYPFEGPNINRKWQRYEYVGRKTKKEAQAALRKALNEFESVGSIFNLTDSSVHYYFKYWYDDYVMRNQYTRKLSAYN